MSHPVGQPFKDNGEGRCWHCGRTASEHPGITQAEIARQDIRERHDFAALHARGRTSTFYYETKSRERLADGLEAFESLSQADAAHRRRMVRRQLKVLGLVPLNSDDFNSMSQQVRDAGVEPWLACIHRHEKTGAPCMLRVHDGGDHYYASPSREELLRVKVESVGPERREPFLDGYGAQGEVLTYQEGDPVEVLFEDGWRSGGVFRSYRAGGRDEHFHRVDVTFPATGRIADGCHPDCVRRPYSVGPFPAVPAFNSPEAVAQAAETIRSFAPVRIDRWGQNVVAFADDGRVVFSESPDRNRRDFPDDEAMYREAEERARLRAAAPDLADALEAVRDLGLTGNDGAQPATQRHIDRVLAQINAALAKAGR